MEAESALVSLLKKLTDLLGDECARLKGVRGEVRFLQSELNSMYALLQRCATMEKPDVQLKAWTKEVRELAYHIEDCVDMFVHRIGTNEHPGQGGIKEFFSSTAHRLKTLGTRHHIAKKIQELKARVIEVREQRERYMLGDVAATTTNNNLAIDPRLCALFMEEADLVGIDDPRDKLARLLVEGEPGNVKDCMVLSIFGFGGLGKTTLAKEIRRKIGKQFDCEAFASVSQNLDLKKVLLDILSGIPKKDDECLEGRETWDERRLIEKTRELLYQNRYLIIIDDIWSIAAWNLLKCALPENNNGSRVITTTRIESVANACCSRPSDICHKIQPLSTFHSRSLFFKRIFGSADGCPNQLEDISVGILKKCGGLPLAIISIASLLASRPIHTVEYWEEVMVSIGSGLQNNPDLESMNTILSLSYNNLPHYLKPCLLYLCIFPEDHYIERDSLMRRWIAEGFVNEECGKIVEVVAESYFNELINRSMILPIGIGYYGKAPACRLHDMMLDLIISKANEENFITVIGPRPNSPKPTGVIRRVSIQYQSEDDMLEKMGSLSQVRSFSVFGIGNFHSQTLPFSFFRVLRVLSLDCEVTKAVDLEIICKKQYQLKYLRLNGFKLPVRVGELKRLETVELRNYPWELPCGFSRLKHLRHLHVHNNNVGKLPEGISAMKALQTLSEFNICDSPVSAVQELGNLKNLRELTIYWENADPRDPRYKEYFSSSLVNLSSNSLRCLSIKSKRATSVEFLESLPDPPYLLQKFWMWNSYFQRCPKWIAPLNRLMVLKLDVVQLEDADVRLLGELPALLLLGLWVVALRKEKIIINGTGFQSLEGFQLWSGLPCLTFQHKSMPKLEILKLSFSASGAKSYGSTHSGIEHLTSLKSVEVAIYKVASNIKATKREIKHASASSINAADREIRHSIAKHPNNLKIHIFHSNNSYFGEVMNDDDVFKEPSASRTEGQ